jgi:hypothetical protein
MKKSKNPKKNTIELFIDTGMFNEPEEIGTIKQLLNDAGGMLDDACSHEITGTPIFRCADGKWYVGSVEFCVNPVAPDYLVQSLADGEHCECQNCGHIDHRDDLGEIADYSERVSEDEEAPDGECTKCGALSHEITKARAEQIAGITKKKPARRRGGLK